ncbi:MAG: ABC transporter ATP-binding protein [Proteobacteria bacterium]|nr:ABC transporter ATP-binding protein [Pseudomonadota bacterium]MBI3499737.1 ABC transporter ATP-binding protein [Pseudomonadota bacterium]
MSRGLLTAENVRAGYVPGMPIIHDVSLEIATGEIVTIIGPNGAGKSTLLKALAGLIAMEAGSVVYGKKECAGLSAEAMAGLGIGFVPQTGNVFVSLTIQENLKVGGHTLTDRLLKERLERSFERFPMLAKRRASLGGTLSGGERQTLAIARALMTEPKLLMLDEPTASLSPRAVGEVFQTLRRLASGGVAVLMVEQNAKAALRMSDRGYVLTEGRNRMSGAASALLADPTMGQAFLGGARRQ